ncbi:MAG: DUF3726 domain-containing protein [Ruegeria sp.]
MNLSLNEIEATAKRAARGAGYPWGLAEEAAKATRWLCSRDVDGCSVLAGHLEHFDGAGLANLSPSLDNRVWSAVDGTLCPISTGATLSDFAHRIADSDIQLGQITQPVFLAPFAALLARHTKKTVTVEWQDGGLSTDGDQISLKGTVPKAAPWATVRVGGQVDTPNQHCHRAQPHPDTWARLGEFAHRTYAPATEESRRKGAGAGLSDND